MDGKWGRLILTSLGCVLLILLNDLTIYEMNLMWFSYLALPFLFFYNGKRGKWNLKYMFYIFYPLHLVLLEAIAMIVSGNIIF